MSKYIWTADRITHLVDCHDAGVHITKIAKSLDVSVQKCRDKLTKLNEGIDAMPDKTEYFTKKCLQCRKEFEAEKVIFLCDGCKATAVFRGESGDFALVGV